MIDQHEKEAFFGLEQANIITNGQVPKGGQFIPNQLNTGLQEGNGVSFSSANSITHPSYYANGKMETWDFIKDKNLDFDRGSAIKYIVRAGEKDKAKEIEDLKKAINFINHEIDYLSGLAEQGKPWNPNLTEGMNEKEVGE